MVQYHIGSGATAQEILLGEYDHDGRPGDYGPTKGYGAPISPKPYSWNDVLAAVCCSLALAVALVVVFEPRIASYLCQNNQFICVGLCLTLMGWCAQLPLRRVFLISSTNSRASTLQSIDAILRSDPFTDRADLRVRFVLIIMLGLGPALSVAYKALGDGETRFSRNHISARFGLTGPPGTQDIGYGLSQFVNATLPWFKDPGVNRVYGFNMHVSTENKSAMLDGPMPDYIHNVRRFMGPNQSKILTATVPAIVCELNSGLDHDVEYFQNLTDMSIVTPTLPSYVETWVTTNSQHVAMLMPVLQDNSNIVIGNWDKNLNETFGSHLQQYTLSRQKYKGSWRVSQGLVELIDAAPTDEHLDDHCLITSNWLALPDLYTRMFYEYDWRYRSAESEPFYTQKIKSDSTLLAVMLWSRIVAMAPATIIFETSNPECLPNGMPVLQYNTDVLEEITAKTIQPGGNIIIVLALYPMILFASLLFHMTTWPLAPIGEGFGLISLLASVEKSSLALLQGASFSGKLERPIFVGLQVGPRTETTEIVATGTITSILGFTELSSGRLRKGIKYG